MSAVRVMHVITMLELGGAQQNTLDTCARLDRERFVVGLACADDGELLPEARRLGDVRLHELPSLRREVRPWLDARAVGELRRAIREFAPEIVHTHSSKAGILGRLAAHRERVPVVVHSIHGWGFGPHQAAPLRAAFLTAERLASRWTTAFIAVSRENLEQGLRLGLFGREQVSLIRSGIDLRAFRQPTGGGRVRAELGIPDEAPLVVQVSCLKAQKAPERFVALAAALAPRFPEAHFLLVGDGELRGQIEAQRRAAGLAARLHLPGWRRDIPAVLDAATVVTLTSRFEGLPRAIVEALAAGKPVAAMAVDGVLEILQDGVNGFAVPPGDTGGLVDRVAELLASPGRRAELASHAGEGLDDFDRELMVHQQEALYGRLLTGAAAGRVAAGAGTRGRTP
ncbi:MAG TPA: glycosyltransferase family 4 protein [Thermoanaerobaculaceae bacterium]|nr:glycosyltransferase family 4 protein [Thermoanaerobaculaceae bacterium]HPS77048.1 glycosyltransferase family 4 protein [Thermoanaerobaculaceae bacterium]